MDPIYVKTVKQAEKVKLGDRYVIGVEPARDPDNPVPLLTEEQHKLVEDIQAVIEKNVKR